MKSKSKFLTSLSLAFIAVLAVSVFSAFSVFAAEAAPECSLSSYARGTNSISVVVTSDECTGYEVEYSTNSDMTDSSVITSEYGAEFITISDLTPGTNYYIQARSYTAVYTEDEEAEDTEENADAAVDETETVSEDTDTTGAEYIYGEYSNILADATLPGTPSISYAKNSVSAIRFDINGTVGGSGYEAKYSKNSDMSSSKTTSVEKVGSSQGRISGLKSGTVYYIQLRAYVNINGNKVYGSWSSKMKGITKSDPTTITFTKYSAEAVRVKISKVACSGYQVRYSKNSDMSSSKTVKAASTDKEVRITGLKSGTKYYVQIRTYAKLSSTTYYSSWSKKIPVTAKPVKSTISSTSSPSSSSIKVKVKSQTCTGYQIQYSSKKDFSTSKSKYLSSGKSSLTIGSLKAGTTYYVRVRAYRTCNGVKYYGPWSAKSSQKVYKSTKIVTATTLMKSNSWASTSLASLAKGTTVRLISSSGRWYKVMYGTTTGYVYNLGFKSYGSINLSRSKVTSSNYTTYLDDLIFSLGKNSYTLFRYVCNHMSYSYSKISRAQRNAGIHSASKVLANQGELTAVAIRQRGGICYNYAAFTKTLLERAGYSVQYIYGSNKNGSHCWVLIKTSKGYRHVDAVRKAYEYTDYQMRHSSNTSDFRWSTSSYPKCS